MPSPPAVHDQPTLASKERITDRSQPSPVWHADHLWHASPTAVAAAGAASGTASETAGDANEMKWLTPSESGALKNGSANQRKQNKKMME